MANLRSDSPICRRIVLSFLDFLSLVQPAPGVDPEGLEVARDCLQEVFKLNSLPRDDNIPRGALLDLFSALETGDQCKEKSDLGPSSRENASSTTSSSQQVEDTTYSKALNGKDQVGTSNVIGRDSEDELFGKFFAALDKINFFKTSPDGNEDEAQVAKAMQFFDDAVMEMENSEGQIINLNNLAEMFKSKGNRSMQLKAYDEAIELYTCAIALRKKNAIYYSNRAAAFTLIHRFAEAIQDCFKSIEIDPGYCKAYSRLGLAYYEQGNYTDALNKGFLKALQLDPNNETVKENIRAAKQKMMEQNQQTEDNLNNGSNHGQQSGESSNQGTYSASFSFNASMPPEFESTWSSSQGDPSSFFRFTPPTPPVPPEFGNVFSAATQESGTASGNTPFTPSFSFNGSNPVDFADVLRRAHEGRTSDAAEGGADEPEIRFGEAPEQFQEVLRSVLGMFSPQQHGSQQGTDRGNS